MNLKPLIFLLLMGSVFTPVGADFPRHVDPSLLDLDNPDPVALFDLYSGIYGSIVQSDYTQAFELIVTIDELFATPEGQKSISDYNELLRQVIYELNKTEVNLDQAINELFWLRETDAYNSLLEAAPHLVNANSTTFDLTEESQVLARVLDGSPVELLAGTERVEAFVDALDQVIIESFLRVDQIIADKLAGLEETTLIAGVNNTIPFPGDTVNIQGTLFSSAGGLVGKSIEVKLAGSVHGIVETGANGVFNYVFKMPEIYVNAVPLQVSYWPPPTETGLYSPALHRLTLRPSFFTPSLSLEVPLTVYPGIQYPIKSKILYRGEPLSGLSFIIQAFGKEKTYTSGTDEETTVFVNVPANIPTGSNPVTLVFPGQGIYGPASITKIFVAERVEAFIEIDTLGVHLSGGNAVVSGEVKSLIFPIPDCVVEVQLGDNLVSTITDEDGEFRTMFPIALMTPSIRREYTVTATPQESWISKAYLSNSFLVLNSLSLVAVPGLAVFFIYIRKPRTVFEPPLLPVSPIHAPVEYREVSGLAGVYLQAVNIVTRITGYYLGPSTTIREYLDRVRHRVKSPFFSLFRRLSRLYEGWVYGPKSANPPLRTSGIILERMQEEDEQN